MKSAFTTSMTPGYIFVEAPSVRDAWLACQDFVGIRGSLKEITLIPAESAVALLKHQPPRLRLYSWVRIRLGPYAGDLAYLFKVDTDMEHHKRTQGMASAAVIPRISQILQPHSQASMKRKRVSGRPSQRFFNPLEWGDARKLDRPHAWSFRKQTYAYGLLELRVPINALNLQATTPTRSELQQWMTCADPAIAEFVRDSYKMLAVEFWVGDRVEVTSGDHMTRRGIIQQVDSEEISVLVRTNDFRDARALDEPEVSCIVVVSPSCLRKVFLVGDYVEVISDNATDLQGFVVAVDLTNPLHSKVTVVEHGERHQVSGYIEHLTPST